MKRLNDEEVEDGKQEREVGREVKREERGGYVWPQPGGGSKKHGMVE